MSVCKYVRLYIGYVILEWTKLVCTPASTALFAYPGGTDCVQVRYRHIRQAAIPARVVLGTACVIFFRCTHMVRDNFRSIFN